MKLLLLDEAQLLFGRDDLFWSGIKALHKGPQPGQRIASLRVIMACSYVCSPSAFAGQYFAKFKCPKSPSCWVLPSIATDCTVRYHRKVATELGFQLHG